MSIKTHPDASIFQKPFGLFRLFLTNDLRNGFVQSAGGTGYRSRRDVLVNHRFPELLKADRFH